MSVEAKVEETKSWGSVWKTGDAIWGYEPNKYMPKGGRYTGLLCVKAKVVGPKGGLKEPARMVAITGPTWISVKRACQALGFTMPRLTAEEVRLGIAGKKAS